MQIFNQKVLSATVSMLMTWSLCQVATTHAGDIDIYKLPEKSKVTLFMMFDTSGSMGWGDNYGNVDGRNSASSLYQDYNICPWRNDGSSRVPIYNTNVQTESKTYKVGSRATQTYNVDYCSVPSSVYNGLNDVYKVRIQSECTPISGNNYKCYDRLSRLKMALVQVLSSTEISDSVQIGLGQFSSPKSEITSFSQDGVSGRVLYPVVNLSEANRDTLISRIVALEAYNGTPSASAYGESGAYMLGANTYNLTNSGYSYSNTNSRNGNKGYIAPLTTAEMKNTCNGQGIYFLTDGFANSSTASQTQAIMNKSISLSGTGLSGGDSASGWTEIGQYAKLLRSGDRNIKTAVVGYGKDFPNGSTYVKDLPVDILDQEGGVVETVQRRFYDCSKLPSLTTDEKTVQNTCNWGAKPHSQLPSSVGGFGNGGFYSAKSTQDIVESIKYFVDDIKPRFKPVATGSPTIPIDQLNPVQVQPYGYYAQFTPKPQEGYQLWLGNLNKYYTKDGELKGLNDTALIQANGKLNPSASGIWGADGMKGKIPLGTDNTTQNALRNVFTNRKIDNLNQAQEDSGLQAVDLKSLFGRDSTEAKLLNDPKKNYWLNILGYAVDANATGLTATNLPTIENRQIGAVMHSTPILLTQSGKVDVLSNGTVTSSDRADYLLFGSTQGILHVVKAGKPDLDPDPDAGKEVFAFVPHEIMEKQSLGFLSEGNTNEGRANLYYGVDGAWTAFSQYVSNSDGSLTIKDSDRTDLQTKKGMQLVFGGMRMGGRSYYALDLQNIEKPELKFHINPQDTVTNADSTRTIKATLTNSTGTKTVEALSFMGQSWSKPTVTYINWKGKRKLVMFVGGGYDTEYENTAYDQSNKKGAGVYMFDANDGELLWWASANSSSDEVAYTANVNLKYSVVSQINAVDRDNDGLSDTLYFGDLGGQAFRIDLNNKTTSTDAFATRVVRLYNGHLASGKSPRFYEMPSFSAQDKGVDGLYGILALSSGNRSSPLAGKFTSTNNVTTTTTSAKDGVFVIFDHDIARVDLYSIKDTSLRTQEITNLPVLDLKVGVADATVNGTTTTYNGGWVYYYPTSSYGDGHIKGMNELYALDSMLYVNAYDKDGVGITGACGSGVIGDSYLYQFCLPSGKCKFYTSSTTEPNRVKLGGGILGTGLGQAYSGGGMGLIVKREGGKDCSKVENKNLPECQLFDAKSKLQHLRWYESR
ncbi:PilC/PilY family type IV pilus protein [uncultured Acinetobacter sp.]|uniref:PilC/PilY family type IV pilus protein n=1 Tax=uncultured Acinetobacter sp. TaxID=165433 RepID=UPI0025FC8300|nr:PilC/PilY family type IV pilus protein [uncultured Acinetobacter sp.]